MPLSRSAIGSRRGSPWTGVGTVVAKETADHGSRVVLDEKVPDPSREDEMPELIRRLEGASGGRPVLARSGRFGSSSLSLERTHTRPRGASAMELTGMGRGARGWGEGSAPTRTVARCTDEFARIA